MTDQGTRLSSDDRALLERNFFIEDPVVLASIVDAIPADVSTPGIAWKYDLPHSRPKVRCAVCGAHRHWKGYVVDLGEGRHALLGGDCGRDAFGFVWDREESAFLRLQDRQLDLRRYVAAEPFMASLEAELAEALRSDEVAVFERYMAELRKTFGKFSQALVRAARSDGRLEGTEKKPDLGASRELARIQRPDLFTAIELAPSEVALDSAKRRLAKYLETTGRVLVDAEVIVGYMDGRILFTQGGLPSLVQPLAAALSAIKAARAVAPAEADGIGFDVIRTLENVRVALEEMQRALTIADAFDRFTSIENTALVAEWTAKSGRAFPQHFTPVMRSLRWGDTRRLEVPTSWAPPHLPSLALLEHALSSDARAG